MLTSTWRKMVMHRRKAGYTRPEEVAYRLTSPTEELEEQGLNDGVAPESTQPN